MTIQSDRDLERLRDVGGVVARTLAELRRHVVVGVTTAELDGRCAELLAREGVRPAPADDLGFPGSLCISVDEEAVHGVPGARRVARGDLVKLDLVASREGAYADAALTVPVAPVAPERLRLVRSARRALRAALRVLRPGRPLRDVGRAIEREVRRAGFRVIPELGGHGVGAAIHEAPDVPNFEAPSGRERLHEGLVLAIEPIVTSGDARIEPRSDGWTIATVDGAPVAHHEHTVVVTSGAPLVLTA